MFIIAWDQFNKYKQRNRINSLSSSTNCSRKNAMLRNALDGSVCLFSTSSVISNNLIISSRLTLSACGRFLHARCKRLWRAWKYSDGWCSADKSIIMFWDDRLLPCCCWWLSISFAASMFMSIYWIKIKNSNLIKKKSFVPLEKTSMEMFVARQYWSFTLVFSHAMLISVFLTSFKHSIGRRELNVPSIRFLQFTSTSSSHWLWSRSKWRWKISRIFLLSISMSYDDDDEVADNDVNDCSTTLLASLRVVNKCLTWKSLMTADVTRSIVKSTILRIDRLCEAKNASMSRSWLSWRCDRRRKM